MLRPILSWAPIRRLGVLSYGIYLYHMLALWPVSKVFERTGIQSKYVLFVGVATLSWLFAEISYRLFEQRLLSLKARFSSG
jgi:peptidoglycan/LPS O-acetylase OafA/YrhL